MAQAVGVPRRQADLGGTPRKVVWDALYACVEALSSCFRSELGTGPPELAQDATIVSTPSALSVARATLESQTSTATTPAVALTRGGICQGQNRTWFRKLRKQQLPLLS